MLSTSDEIVGRGVMFLYVDDVAAERRRLQGLGIVLGDVNYARRVRDTDPGLRDAADDAIATFVRHNSSFRAR